MGTKDKMSDIDFLRDKIDKIDDEMLRLNAKRISVSEDIAEYKKNLGLPIYDAKREEDKLRRISEKTSLDMLDANINLYKLLADESQKRQKEVMSGKCYGLIGKNISHSLSPEVHRMLGTINYKLIEIRDKEELRAILKDESYSGFNVTSPYKKSIIKYLDEVTKEALSVNAVNTIYRTEDGRLIGDNTDIYGFMKLVEPASPRGKDVLILGSGGGAAAAAKGMRNLGAENITVVSRSPAQAVNKLRGLVDRIISYQELSNISDPDIIVNATNVGMHPYNGNSPFIKAGISVPKFEGASFAIDLIYNPYRTRFLLDYKDMGKNIMSGLSMLIWQAIKSEKIWGRIREDVDERHLAEIITRRCLMKQLNIAFIGMPGSGKSSISRRLAKSMDREFIDIDRISEKQMNKTIQEVIVDEDLGEKYFRKIETSVLARECKKSGKVIATGGGSIIRKINRNCIRQNSIVVYMRRPLKLITTKNRPISKKEGVLNIYKKRSGIYKNTADIIIFNDRMFGGTGPGGRSKNYDRDINGFALELRELIEKKVYEMAARNEDNRNKRT